MVLYYLGQYLCLDKNNIEVLDVSDMDTWSENTDRFKNDEHRDVYDVRSTIHLTVDNNEQILIKGGFDEVEDRRYFLWVDGNTETAYFANTVNIDNLTPFSARVTGLNNINYLVHKCVEGSMRNDEEFEKVLKTVNATILDRDPEAKQTDSIAMSLLEGKSGPSTLEQAHSIESVIKNVYEYEGNMSPYQN